MLHVLLLINDVAALRRLSERVVRSAGCWSTLLLPSLHSMRGQGAYSRGGRGVDKIARGSFRKVKFTKGPGVLCSLIVGEYVWGSWILKGANSPL